MCNVLVNILKMLIDMEQSVYFSVMFFHLRNKIARHLCTFCVCVCLLVHWVHVGARSNEIAFLLDPIHFRRRTFLFEFVCFFIFSKIRRSCLHFMRHNGTISFISHIVIGDWKIHILMFVVASNGWTIRIEIIFNYSIYWQMNTHFCQIIRQIKRICWSHYQLNSWLVFQH